jgi:histone deacetylase 1/2
MAMNDEDEAELDDLDEDRNGDKRHTQRRFEKYVEKPGELSDSEDEEMNEANGVRKQPDARKRRNMLDYRNLTEFNGDSAMTSGAATPQAASSLPDNDMDDDLNIEDADADQKGDQVLVAALNGANGEQVASTAQSPKAADDGEDVAMEDSSADVAPEEQTTVAAAPVQPAPAAQQEVTPPDSPPNAPGIATPASSAEAGPSTTTAEPAIKDEMAAEDAAVKAEAEGLTEREAQNAQGEAAAEQASTAS